MPILHFYSQIALDFNLAVNQSSEIQENKKKAFLMTCIQTSNFILVKLIKNLKIAHNKMIQDLYFTLIDF